MQGMGGANSNAWNSGDPRRFPVRNTEEEVIPPFAVMEISEIELLRDGRIEFEVKKMTADGTGNQACWIFNIGGTIPKASFGRPTGFGTFDFPVQALVPDDETPGSGESIGPIEGEWFLSGDGGGLTVIDKDKSLAVEEEEIDGTEVSTYWVCSDGSSKSEFFCLLEDMPSGHGVYAHSQFFDWNGDTFKGKLYNWGKDGSAILNGAQAGYWGSAEWHKDRWRFEQGPCFEKCLHGGSLSYPDPLPNGEDGTPYSATPSASGLNNDIGATGLPSGLSINPVSGDITGTPTETGDFTVVITATADKIGGAGACTVTVYRPLKITEPVTE